MSLHDLDIANQTFPSFRADMNNAINAIASLFISDTAPASTIAGMPWIDTTNDVLKIRNEANNGWVHFADFDWANLRMKLRSDILQAIGSSGLSFRNAGGTEIFSVSDSGAVSFTGGFTASGDVTVDGMLNVTRDNLAEQIRIGYGKAGTQDVYIGFYRSGTTRKGYIQARSDRLRIHNDAGEYLDLKDNGNLEWAGGTVFNYSDSRSGVWFECRHARRVSCLWLRKNNK